MLLRRALIVAFGLAAGAPACAQTASPAGSAVAPAKPTPAAVTKAATPGSTAEQRSAAALALSHEPTFDEGTAQRIKEAALSYSALAVRGGWPAIPADAKFTLGVAGPNDDLLRKRLIMSGDLAADKAGGAFDQNLTDGVKRFQARHGLAVTGTVTPRTIAAMNVPVQTRIRQLEASLERFVETATATLRGRGSVTRRLSALVEATAEHYGRDELLRASLVGESHLVDGRAAELAAEIQRTRIRRLLSDILEEGRRAGTVRSDLDPTTAAAVLFEMGWGVVRAGLEGVTGVPLDVALADLNDIVGRGIRNPKRRGR